MRRISAECSDTAINAVKADIQAMEEGEAKTTATKEMEAAQQMFGLRMTWRRARATYDSAMEATEK